MTSLLQHSQAAHETAAYDLNEQDTVIARGLREEFEEIREVDHLFAGGFYDNSYLTPEKRLEFIKELGDFLWYINEQLRSRGLNLGDAAHLAILRNNSLPLREEFDIHPTTITAEIFDRITSLPNQTPFRIQRHKALAFAEYCNAPDERQQINDRSVVEGNWGLVFGRVVDRCDLAVRRERGENIDGGPPTDVDFDEPVTVEEGLADILWVMSEIAQKRLGSSITEILQINQEKLARRLGRGTLLAGADEDRSSNTSA